MLSFVLVGQFPVSFCALRSVTYVMRPVSYSILIYILADNLCCLHDTGDTAAGEYVDCYDGSHVRNCQRVTERMVSSGALIGEYPFTTA